MAGLWVQQIQDLQANFQRLDDEASWVRAGFILKARRFGMFGLGRPDDVALIRGIRSNQEAAIIAELYLLTDQAGVLVEEIFQSGCFQGTPIATNYVHVNLQRPWQSWLVFLMYFPPMTFLCRTRTDEGNHLVNHQLGDNETAVFIENYPRVCMSALTLLKAKSIAAVPLAQNMTQWVKSGPFGLTLDYNKHTVERNGRSVEFGEHGRAWQVFVKLVERHPARFLVKDLGRAVWNPNGNDVDPGDNLVQQAVVVIRKLLKLLGIGVQHTRGLGYIITDFELIASEE
jgi:hypothetical protein